MVTPEVRPNAQTYLQAKPKSWKVHRHEFFIVSAASSERVWAWLNNPETFTKGQVPPYRVEFVSPDPENIAPGFHVGVQTVHHGPFLNFAGVINEIREGEYRDLQYYYGSFALSLRWIRPLRLQFWVEELEPGITRVRGQVDSYVKPWIFAAWTWAQQIFWGSFGRLLRKHTEIF
ncbi:MAG: hypothetical protein AAF804_08175 [Bacteroidota bacterium]